VTELLKAFVTRRERQGINLREVNLQEEIDTKLICEKLIYKKK